MAIPPPPPPGPPPPPAFKLSTSSSGGGGGGSSGDSRNALLLSIQKGAKLKKTVTNDKSGPAVAGKVAGSSGAPTSSSSNGERRAGGPGGGGIGAGGGVGGSSTNGNGGPKLAGIFGGMSEMPKLKPVNRGAGNQSTLHRSPPKASPGVDQQNTSISSVNSGGSNSNSSISSSNSGNINGSGALDFNAELTQHLTLKKKKQQQQQQPPQQNQSQPSSPQGSGVTEANLKTNRGPPPQPPPPPKNPPALPPINGISANSSSLFNTPVAAKSPVVPRTTQVIVKIITMEPQPTQNQQSTTPQILPEPDITPPHITDTFGPNSLTDNTNNNNRTSIIPNVGTATPNASSLFNNCRRSPEINSDPSHANAHSIDSTSSTRGQSPPQQDEVPAHGSVSEMKRLLSASSSPKPVPNFGKPNLAPKPPGNQLTPGGANGSTPTSPLLSSGLHGAGKATVSRHHSMKTPRSPPVAPPPPGGPVFPSQNHFGTMRAPSSQYQSQETISSNATGPPVNGRPIGRPTVAPPPRPPPNKPPPPPLRSVSNQNLPQMSLSTPTTNTLNSAASANNVNQLKEQLKHHIGNGSPIGGGSAPSVEKANSNGNSAAPPLPPHRTCPAPPPPNASRQASNNSTSNSSAPPVPPQRHSSIRSVSVTDSVPPPITKSVLTATPNGGMSAINRIIVDLESKFADRFHNPTEFSKPAPFFKTEKHYPSLSQAKNAAEVRKQRAPRPPPNPATRAPAPLPARQQAPLPPLPHEGDCDTTSTTLREHGDKENMRSGSPTTEQSEQCFIHLTDSKLFANESSNC